MKLMVLEMEATSFVIKKLESKAKSLILSSLLVLQKELAKVFEEKIKSKQLVAFENSELFRDFNILDLEYSILKFDIQHLGVKLRACEELGLGERTGDVYS